MVALSLDYYDDYILIFQSLARSFCAVPFLARLLSLCSHKCQWQFSASIFWRMCHHGHRESEDNDCVLFALKFDAGSIVNFAIRKLSGKMVMVEEAAESKLDR
jgi:hypothetical protein